MVVSGSQAQSNHGSVISICTRGSWMRGRRPFGALVAVVASLAALLGLASSAGGALRDDTEWLQAKLDAGGAFFLPRLPDGRCYATRGLWVSRDDTTVTSDGACMIALGPGEGRIPRGNGE